MAVKKVRVVTCKQAKKNPTKKRARKSMKKATKRPAKKASKKSVRAKANPSGGPAPSLKFRAKKAAKKAGRRAADATKSIVRKGGRKSAELTRDAAVWTGKKIAKGGKRAGKKAWGTTKGAASGAWKGMIKGWKENPVSVVPKATLDRVAKLDEKSLELYALAEQHGLDTKDGKHYEREADRLLKEAQELLYPYSVHLDHAVRTAKHNPVTKEQRRRMSKSLFAIPARRSYRLDSPARAKYSLTLLDKHYDDGARSKQDYETAYVNIMVSFIKNGQVTKRAPRVKTAATLAAFKAASPVKNPAKPHPVSLKAKQQAMRKLLATCKRWVKQDRSTAANCKAIEAQLKRVTTKPLTVATANPTHKRLTGKEQATLADIVGTSMSVTNEDRIMTAAFSKRFRAHIRAALMKKGKPVTYDNVLGYLKSKGLTDKQASTYAFWFGSAQDSGYFENPVKKPSNVGMKKLSVMTNSVKGGAVYLGETRDGKQLSVGPYHTATGKGRKYALVVGNLPHVLPLREAVAQFNAMAQQGTIRRAPMSRSNPTCRKANPSKPRSGAWYYKMTYETWSPEDVEIGDTDDKGWAVEQSEPYDTLEELLDAVEGEASWLEWSSSPAQPGDWIVSEGSVDYKTGDTTNHSLWIERADGKPLTRAQMKKITNRLGLHGARFNPTCRTATDKKELRLIEKNLEHRVGMRRSRGAAKALPNPTKKGKVKSFGLPTRAPKSNPAKGRSGKIPATSITITRTEGGNHDLNEPHELVGGDIWNKANVLLSLWGREAEPNARNKVKFHVRYADGETYSGSYFVSRKDAVTAHIGQHILTTLKAASGKMRPSHMTADEYKKRIAKIPPKQKKAYAEFLRKYQIGSPNCKA